MTEGINRQYIRDELMQLEPYQIREVGRTIGMDENSFTGDYIRNHRGDAISDLLDFAQRKNLLGKLKSAIDKEKDINNQTENSHSNNPGELNLSSNDDPSNKCFKQKLAELFLSLDYRDECHRFNDAISKQKGVFCLLREDEETIEDWLVCRLAKKNDAKIFPIDIRRHTEIAIEFETAFCKAFYNEKISRKKLIMKLTHVLSWEKKSVVVVIYRPGLLKGALNKLYEFFLELIEDFKALVGEEFTKARIIFILVETKSYDVEKYKSHFNNETEDNNIILKKLENIPNHEIESWSADCNTSKILEQNFCDLNARFSENLTPKTETLAPVLKLNYICTNVFKIKKGIQELQEYWKLHSIGN